jgi:hypothetical protein
MAITAATSYYDYLLPLWIVPIITQIFAAFAFAWTCQRTYRLHLQRVRDTKPTDPLKPYLIKKEIDVWCYPVQNDTSQPPKQYVIAEDVEQGPPLELRTLASQHIEGQPAMPPPSILSGKETTAAWTIPRSETIRSSQLGPGTALPSYAGPPSTHNTLSGHES